MARIEIISDSVQDVPQGVLDMVRMFLASSTRGDHTVLTLETRNQQIFTKYRSVETQQQPTSLPQTTPKKGEHNQSKDVQAKAGTFQRKNGN